MYLPTFFKTKTEYQSFRGLRYTKAGPALALWGIWAFYPSIYNIVYTDIFPPAKGYRFKYRCCSQINRMINIQILPFHIIYYIFLLSIGKNIIFCIFQFLLYYILWYEIINGKRIHAKDLE